MEHTRDQPPPTEDEQQQMAMFWAMEEANTPRGWDDEAELDYMAVSQRQAQAEQTGGSPISKASGKLILVVGIYIPGHAVIVVWLFKTKS